MTELLLKKFVKDYNNTKNSKVREQAGVFSSFVGVFCNILLFVTKFVIGTISGSISIISDGFNNLSDCFSCIITMVGYKLANQPADKEHPFGHGRIEYLCSLVISALIIYVGIEFLKTSFGKIINPTKVRISVFGLVGLAISIIAKIALSAFNKNLFTRYNSPAMQATSQDSLSDAITTSVTLVGSIISTYINFPVDGIIGCLVSLVIIKAGYEIIKDTIDSLLGKPADEETVSDILAIVKKYPSVIGIHDMMVHNYGPGNIIASFHAEVSSENNILVIHDEIDQIEKEIYVSLGILSTIHMDPIETNNQTLNTYKQLVLDVLKQVDAELSMHDFRMVSGQTHTNLIFDVVVPYKYIGNTGKLKENIDTLIQQKDSKLFTVITFDTQF